MGRGLGRASRGPGCSQRTQPGGAAPPLDPVCPGEGLCDPRVLFLPLHGTNRRLCVHPLWFLRPLGSPFSSSRPQRSPSRSPRPPSRPPPPHMKLLLVSVSSSCALCDPHAPFVYSHLSRESPFCPLRPHRTPCPPPLPPLGLPALTEFPLPLPPGTPRANQLLDLVIDNLLGVSILAILPPSVWTG